MEDLQIAPGPGIPGGLVVPARELAEQFSHASGPGGQGVNTSDSRVQLSLDIASSAAFSEEQRARILASLGSHLAGGVVQVNASEDRSQLRNRRTARLRMAALLRDALAPPAKARRATRPSRGAQLRRLASKHSRSELKQSRRRPEQD